MSGRRTFSPPATRRRTTPSPALGRPGRAPGGGRGPCGRAAVVAAASFLLVGCSEEPAVPPPTEARPGVGEVVTGADGVQEITLQTQDDYVFTPDSFTVRPGDVRLTVINVGEQMVHNFRFTPGKGPEEIDAQIDILPAGEQETLEFEVAADGEHPFECTFHVQLGQVGTMTVSG